MGIPKFFRFISERWPMISQFIDENQIPEFDNLYLDMNSILHTCTHSNDDSLSRMTEDQMYAAIFNYIEHLFEIIRPNKLFYMAIDGVAPRAKMNQQRARRFRTAYEAEENLKKAIAAGETIPSEDPFDSNSITPGTEFMAKLTTNLKYFIHKKISTDSNWANIRIILSGHEVPGEGEHKIMDYIRIMKSQDDYDPNVRQCIYGLDADLIMLGLVSHDPHFSLLREEVTFGPQRGKKSDNLNDQKFYLLHLSLLREYLELEFLDLKKTLTFDYDFERVLDDFILIMYVIGNDFLPNLPDLFINKGAFPLLIETFKQTLKQSDGYINEGGKINLKRLNIWLHHLSDFELENFERADVDIEWFNKKLDDISITGEKKRKRIGKLLILKEEKKLVGYIKPWLMENVNKKVDELIELENKGELTHLELKHSDVESNFEFLKTFALEAGLLIVHIKSKDLWELKLDIDGLPPSETDEEFEVRIQEVRKIIKKYQSANLIETEEVLKSSKDLYDTKFRSWKDKYYKDKLKFSIEDTTEMVKLTKHYIEGLQWVLYYYYKGCQSWNWYYKYHYSPRISDISIGLEEMIKAGEEITFEMSIPFKPFEQLMAVLPARSRALMPNCYRPLMTDERSPIHDFYPNEVDIDMNGKAASWEAVVLLDFVDEERLLKVLKPMEAKLSADESKRNSLGESIQFVYNPQINYIFPSPIPGIFKDLENDKCYEIKVDMPALKNVRIGLVDGAKTGKHMLAGFPSLSTLKFKSELKKNEVKIFNFPTKSESMILTVENDWASWEVSNFSEKYLNKIVYSKWPFLRESKVVKVVTGEEKYESVKVGGARKIIASQLHPDEFRDFRFNVNSLTSSYDKNKGVKLGKINTLVYVQPVNGLIRNAKGAYVKTFAKETEVFPLQLIVKDVHNKDQRYQTRAPLPIDQEFPVDSRVIFLGDMGYGSAAKIVGYNPEKDKVSIRISKIQTLKEPIIGKQRLSLEARDFKYYPSFEVGKQLRLNGLLLSKLTSIFMIEHEGKRVNIGLELKIDGKRQKVLGYTKKVNDKFWEFSPLAVDLIQQYKKKFPGLFAKLAKIDPKSTPRSSEVTTADELKQIRAWLKQVKSDLILVSLESESLTKFSYQAIEQYMEDYIHQHIPVIDKDIKGVPRDAIIKAEESSKLLSDQKFELGDRISYIQDFGKAPTLSKGTIVSITTNASKTELGIIFDYPLMNGNNMNGKLTTKRGLTLDSSLVLNITNRQFVYHSNASKGRKPLTDAQKAERAEKAKKLKEQEKALAKKKELDEKERKEKSSNEILSLLRRGQAGAEVDNSSEKVEEKEPIVEKEENGHGAALNAHAIKQIYGQIYSNVMNEQGVPVPVPGPGAVPVPNGHPGFNPYAAPQPFAGHGFPPAPGPGQIPYVPGIPLPGQFFAPNYGAPAPPASAPPAPEQDVNPAQSSDKSERSERGGRGGRGRGGARGSSRGGRGGRGRGGARGRGKAE